MSSSISFQNVELLDENYSRWRDNPRSVDPEWAAFFEGFELGTIHLKNRIKKAETAALENGDGDGNFQRQVDMLIYSYRDIGHTLVDLDPLEREVPVQPLLDPEEFGFKPGDLDKEVSSKYFLRGKRLPLRDLIAELKKVYCNSIGAEFMYIQNPHIRHWLRDRIESYVDEIPTRDQKLRMLEVLLEVEGFEGFLHAKYVGQKRFSLEGGDALMVILDTLLQNSPDTEVEEMVMGMAHRGRLSVLANFLHKSPELIFNEFSENFVPQMVAGDGDVKYHLGYESVRETLDGKKVEIRLAANPSHLEAVNPVVEGKVRARQRIRKDTKERKRVVPVLIHGDAAFAGQGVVAEVLNMSQLPGYRTGGTIHIIVNNQIGFTTLPADARSTPYATDVAKMIEAPIFHVNGDDPVAVAFVSRLALAFRQEFGRDVVIDMYCYRKHGHNEGDEPFFTQPNMYKLIKEHPTPATLYAQKLVTAGEVTEEEVEKLREKITRQLEDAQEKVNAASQVNGEDEAKKGSTAIEQVPFSFDPIDTSISSELLGKVANALTTVPEDFAVYPKLKRILLDRRSQIFKEGGPYDWGYAEALAFGSLLAEGTPVRLSGQDCRRGTFSHRHSVLYDENTRERYIPLLNISEDQAQFCVYNSLLSEAAVLGFDYGYAQDYPSMLCLWEAQFGDFANGAQVIIDQFIVSAESKWGRPSGIVMLLPHGYEGQGPEHSSARLERFLQACADENIQVCYPSTPAQYFHMLRRQKRRPFTKPLIVMTPKSMLRSPHCVSYEQDFTSGQFEEILDSPLLGEKDEVKRLVFCTGKIYYELLEHRNTHNLRDVAVIRIEQLYPFHHEKFLQIATQYTQVEKCVWCQEEPQNMGAWNFIGWTLSQYLNQEVCYAGRDASASPAGGSLARHKKRQREVVESAFSV